MKVILLILIVALVTIIQTESAALNGSPSDEVIQSSTFIFILMLIHFLNLTLLQVGENENSEDQVNLII